MVKQGRYAQKGYSYQKDFYTLLVAKMDIYKINKIEEFFVLVYGHV